MISNFKTSLSCTFDALNFEKYGDRYMGAFCYRFNKCFNLEGMTERIVHAVCNCTARPESLLRQAELANKSSVT